MEVQYIDYGVGNKKSVINSLIKIQHEVIEVNKPDNLDPNKPIILPGVGSFSYCKGELERLGFFQTMKDMLESNQIKKLIGICVGHQLLFETGSEEGDTSGFGIFEGSIDHISEMSGLRKNSKPITPNISWCSVQETHTENDLGKFYFIHSFGNSNSAHQVAYHDWNGAKITAVARKNGIWGVQFHPEKSGEVGLKLLNSMILSTEETVL
tara:strand:- start:468 stop:1097 length:630 start_codon:yes stop_codon:yes gene_type:complete